MILRSFAIVFLIFGFRAVAADHLALVVLERNCMSCHNAHDKKGGVVLDRAPLVIDDLQLILDVVAGDDPEMPKNREKLAPEEIAALRDWIETGAGISDNRILRDRHVADRTWWSLAKLEVPEVPVDGDWCRNEVDRFVLAKVREKATSSSHWARFASSTPRGAMSRKRRA